MQLIRSLFLPALLALTLADSFQVLTSEISFKTLPASVSSTLQNHAEQSSLPQAQTPSRRTLGRVQFFSERESTKQVPSLKESQEQRDINSPAPEQFNIEYYAKLGIRTRRVRTAVLPPPAAPAIQEEDGIAQTLRNAVYLNNEITHAQRRQAQQLRVLVDTPFDRNNELAMAQYQHYERVYNISSYKQLPICVVVPTYNNMEQNRHLNNLHSILMQNYSNYHLVIFDDASTDGTGQALAQILSLQQRLPPSRYRIVTNAVQMRAMHNLRRASLEFCRPDDIFLVADGDDELLGRQVFKLFSATFQREQAWFVYSNFLFGALNNVGYSRPYPDYVIASNSYRSYPFVASHLRAFYNRLFLNVLERDLRDGEGEYFRAANDVAICIPILEQAGEHVRYLPEITYFYNIDTGQNNHIIRSREQRGNEMNIRRRGKYAPLEKLEVFAP